jgi:hypothetical protein
LPPEPGGQIGSRSLPETRCLGKDAWGNLVFLMDEQFKRFFHIWEPQGGCLSEGCFNILEGLFCLISPFQGILSGGDTVAWPLQKTLVSRFNRSLWPPETPSECASS